MTAQRARVPRRKGRRSRSTGVTTALRAPSPPPGSGTTGDDVVAQASRRVGDRYVLGARVPMANAGWTGPWDCAEFASWCVYQTSGILFGVDDHDDAMRADAYTGWWAGDAKEHGAAIDARRAIGVAGALLLRIPTGRRGGHIAISDGQGGTVEAHSAAKGVCASSADGRRWDMGVLVPGISYFQSDTKIPFAPPDDVLFVTSPLLRGPGVLAVQKRLAALGYHLGALDGIYGPQTRSAVIAFQGDHGLVPDGEVGATTRAALNL